MKNISSHDLAKEFWSRYRYYEAYINSKKMNYDNTWDRMILDLWEIMKKSKEE